MKRGDIIRLVIAVAIAIVFIQSGAMKLPASKVVLKHQHVFVYARPAMVASAKRVIREGSHLGGVIRRASAREARRMRALGITPDPRHFARATAGEECRSRYPVLPQVNHSPWPLGDPDSCPDPRLFPSPLARSHGQQYLGRFSLRHRQDVIGRTLASDPHARATRFGRQFGRLCLSLG